MMSVVYSAPIVGVSEEVQIGDVLIYNGTGYVRSTAAVRLSLSGRRSTGVAITPGNSETGVTIAVTGPLPSQLTGMQPGAESWVRTDANGRLERVPSFVPDPSDDIMGRVDTTGRVTALSPSLKPGKPSLRGERGDAVSFGAIAYLTPQTARVGIGSADALQNLFDAMGDLTDTSRGAQVDIGEGCYRVEKNIHVKRSGHIRGFGTGGRFAKTVLVFDDGCNLTLESQADSSDGGRCDRLRIEAVAFYGPGASGGTRTTKITAGVVIHTSAYLTQCSFIGFHGRGCEVDGSIGAGYFANYGEFTDCWFEDNTRDGFYIHGGNGNSWQLNTPVSVTNGRPQPALKVFQVSAAGPTFVDVTAEFNDATTANLVPFPATEAIGDYLAICFDTPYQKLTFSYTAAGGSTPGVGGLVQWEYWNGTAWVAFPTLNDLTAAVSGSVGATRPPTAAFTNTIPSRADKRVYWEEPIDWAQMALNGTSGYWSRARVTTAYSTNPILDQGWVHDGAGFFDSSFLGCSYYNPQTEGNATAYKISGPTNRANLSGPYAELDQGPCLLTQNTCVVGGALNGVGLGKQHGGAMVLTNSNTITPLRVPNMNAAGTTTMFSTLGHNSTSMYSYTWGVVGDAGFYAMGYDAASFTWQLRSTAVNFLAYALTSEGNATGPGFMSFPSGFLMSGNRIMTMGAAAPTGPSVRTSGLWQPGDIVFNNCSSTTLEMCWRCSIAGNPGTWQAHNY